MYGLDKSVNLNFIIGAELIQVSIGLNEVILNYSNELNFILYSKFKIIDPMGKAIEVSSNEPRFSKNLVDFLGKNVNKVINFGTGDIQLFFSNDFQLILLDSNDSFESYEISWKDKHIIV